MVRQTLFFGDILVVVPIDVSDSHDRSPWQVRMPLPEFGREATSGLGNDFQRPRRREKGSPVPLELFE